MKCLEQVWPRCGVARVWVAACCLGLLLSAGCAGGAGAQAPDSYWTTDPGAGALLTGPSAPTGVVHITSAEEFDQKVLHSDLPVLVEFYKPGCGACMLMAPVLASVEPEYAGRVTFLSVDSTKVYSLIRSNKIKVTPTCLLFVGGTEVARMIGDRSQGYVRRFIDGALEKGKAS